MAHISRDEVLKIAKISQITIHEHEIEPLANQIEQVLSYAQRVTKVVGDSADRSAKATNIFRDDVAIPTNPEPLRAAAPEREENYFVVPVILEQN